MPRPEFTVKKPGTARAAKSSNPITDWWNSRKERRNQLEEEASRLITNKITENEATLISKLDTIDFTRSNLPKHVLEKKARDNLDICELEYVVRKLIRTLQRNPQTIKVDIREIDKRLLTLTLLMSQSVSQGDVRAAYACRAGLVRGITEIRARIPHEQPHLARQFVEQNAAYLDRCITLVYMAQTYDRSKQNLDNERAKQRIAEDEHKKSVADLHQRLTTNDPFNAAYSHMLKHNSPEDRKNWNDAQQEAYRVLLKLNIDQIKLNMTNQMVNQSEISLTTQDAQIDMLDTQLTRLEIPQDPNQMNKFTEAMQQLTRQMAADDQQTDETLKLLEKLSGEFEQLNNAPGATRVRQMAFDQASKSLEEVKAYEAEMMGLTDKRHKERMDRLGLHTAEELMAARKKAEEIRAAQEQALDQMSEETNIEEEGEENLN